MRCVKCDRPALFRSRGAKSDGQMRTSADHELCASCFRDQGNTSRANRMLFNRMPEAGPTLPPFPPLDSLVSAVALGAWP